MFSVFGKSKTKKIDAVPENNNGIETELADIAAIFTVSHSPEEIDPPAKVDDIERELPTTASERLRDIDRKTFLFAGYMFWALIFVAGASAFGIILAKKYAKPGMPSPSEAPSLSAFPTEILSEAPSEIPSEAPSMSPLSVLHYSVVSKLMSHFGEENCLTGHTNKRLVCTGESKEVAGYSASLEYVWEGDSSMRPISISFSYTGPDLIPNDHAPFPGFFLNDACNIDCFELSLYQAFLLLNFVGVGDRKLVAHVGRVDNAV